MPGESEKKYDFGVYKIKEFASRHEITTRNGTPIEGNVNYNFDKFRMSDKIMYEF